jgi:hypothetical protein
MLRYEIKFVSNEINNEMRINKISKVKFSYCLILLGKQSLELLNSEKVGPLEDII